MERIKEALERAREKRGQGLGKIDPGDEAPLPTAAYTETYSGRQLAGLVEQINAEYDAFERGGARIVDPKILLDEDPPATALDQLSASADMLRAELSLDPEESPRDVREAGYAPQVDDELGRFTRELELRLRRYVDRVKAQERSRYETELQRHAERLQQLAKQQFTAKLSSVRDRYRKAYLDKERRLRERYRDLRRLANGVGRQKAAIYAARRQISEKLELLERVHGELSQLGRQLNHQLDDLEAPASDAPGAAELADQPGSDRRSRAADKADPQHRAGGEKHD